MVILAAEKQRLGGIPANSPGFENWEEEFYNRLAPYLREEFPRGRIEEMLTALLPPGEPASTVEKIMNRLRHLWEGNRRTAEERRRTRVKHIDLESGKMIWYDLDETQAGINRRTGTERREGQMPAGFVLE